MTEQRVGRTPTQPRESLLPRIVLEVEASFDLGSEADRSRLCCHDFYMKHDGCIMSPARPRIGTLVPWLEVPTAKFLPTGSDVRVDRSLYLCNER